MARLNGTITEEQKAEFEAIGDELGLSNQGQIIGALLKAYRELQEIQSMQNELELSDDEQELLSKAVQYSGMSRNEIIKRGTIAEAKKAVSLAKHQAELADLNPDELKKKTIKGVASVRIEQAVTRIMEHNDNAPEQKDRFYISESLVFKLSGSNRKAIKEYFDDHHLMIDDHNQKYSLTIDDNRKGKGLDTVSILGT